MVVIKKLIEMIMLHPTETNGNQIVNPIDEKGERLFEQLRSELHDYTMVEGMLDIERVIALQKSGVHHRILEDDNVTVIGCAIFTAKGWITYT